MFEAIIQHTKSYKTVANLMMGTIKSYLNDNSIALDELKIQPEHIAELAHMIDDNKIHCFFHDKDKVALTSKGYFWSAFEDEMTSKSICVMPPSSRDLPKNIAGVCSDYIGHYK